MRCIDEGRLRAYLDDELGKDEREVVTSHLAGCRDCAARATALRETAAAVTATLAAWVPASAPDGERTARALATFQARLRAREAVVPRDAAARQAGGSQGRKERITAMLMRHSRFLAPRRRPAVVAVALLAIFGLLLALGPVQTVAGGLARQFRVQQFAAVTVRVPAMTGMPQPHDLTDTEKAQLHAQLQAMLGPLGTLDTNATAASAREVTPDEARAFYARHGGALRTPSTVPAAFAGQTPRYGVSDPTSTKYTLNVAVARQYLALLNEPELNALPLPAVDQLTFGLDVPSGVAMVYGDKTKGFGVVQLGSPTLTVPDELDLEAFRAAVLALPGLPEDTVNQVKAVKDWEKTLIVPVPQDATTKNVSIKTGLLTSEPGLLIADGQGRGVLLLWAHDGILYAVGGNITAAEAEAVAADLMR